MEEEITIEEIDEMESEIEMNAEIREGADGDSEPIMSCPDLENKFLLVKVGDVARPASEEEIIEISTKLEDLFEKNGINCITFVTHHAVSIDIVEKIGI